MPITGHKIFWGLTSEVVNTTLTVHPVNTSYNSPIDIFLLPSWNVGSPNEITLPSDFWDDSFSSTGVYLRVAAYDGAMLVSMSKVIPIKHYGKSYTGVGQYFPFSMPLDSGETITVKEMCINIESTGAFFKNAVGEWKYTSPVFPTDESPIMEAMTGAIFVKPDDEGVVSWVGKGWGV